MSELPARPVGPGARLVISGDDIPFGAYQAIYHSLTKKVEKRAKTYKDAVTITFADIQNLHQRLVQITRQYAVKSSRCQITHQFKDDTSREHSSFERFKLSDCSLRSCTTKINYEYDFLVILPAEVPEAAEIAQRYTVNVLLDQDFIDNDNYDAPYFMRGLLIGRNIQVTIEFADYAVSQALHATIDGWVESLPKRSLGGSVQFLYLIEKTVIRYTDSAVRSIALFAGAVGAYQAQSLGEGLYIVLFTISLAFFLFSVVDGLVERFYESLSSLKPMTNILLTEGDRVREADLARRQARAKGIASFLALGVLVAILVGIFSNMLYDTLKPFLSAS